MTPAPAGISLLAVPGVPAVRPGDDLAAILCDALEAADLAPRDGDVLVVAQKVVSKAEDRYVALDEVTPSPRAAAIASEVDKDPRLVEVILSESTEVLRRRPGLVIVAHRLGPVMANAGVDRSNIDEDGRERVLLLPRDPDASAERLSRALRERFGVDAGVVVSDSAGRAWRKGVVGIAIGASGVASLVDERGRPDLSGRPLEVTMVGRADAIAVAAVMAMGEADEGTPAVLVRGLPPAAPVAPASALVREPEDDLFR